MNYSELKDDELVDLDKAGFINFDNMESLDDAVPNEVLEVLGYTVKPQSERQRLGMKREEYGQYVAEQEGATPEAQAQREREIWKQENPIISKIVPSYDPVAGEQAISQSADPRKMDEATIDDLTAGFEGLQKSFIAPVKDIATVPQRGGLAAGTGAIAKGAEIYTGGDLPIGDIMSESFGRTGARKDMGLAEATAEDILRDPLLFAPGVQGSKLLGKMGFEAGLEGVSQAIDPNKQFDVGSIVTGGLVPAAGAGLSEGAKRLAKSKYGEQGAELLKEGLIPLFGGPKKKLAKEIEKSTAGRTIESKLSDIESLQRSELERQAMEKAGVDPTDIEFQQYTSSVADLEDIEIGATQKLDELYSEGKLRPEEYDKALNLIQKEMQEFKEFGEMKTPLFNRSEKWLKESSKDSPRGIASKLMFDESKDLLASQSGKAGERVKRLQSIDPNLIKESDLSSMGTVGLGKDILVSPPLIRGADVSGELLQQQGFRLSPEAMKALYGQVMAEE